MNSLSHVAIIMDGNGRWAKERGKNRSSGHEAGVKNIKKIIEITKKNKIKYLTLFVFSYDNWKRNKNEVFFLFRLLNNFIQKDLKYLIKNKIKIKFIGEKNKLKKSLLKNFKKIENLTSKNFELTIILAFNYSSRLEILNTLKKSLKKKMNLKEINLNAITGNLYTRNIPDPEILIRTGGMNRLSDFLLWQLSYTEIFFIKKLWPDFKEIDYQKVINNYKKIKRNFGSVND